MRNRQPFYGPQQQTSGGDRPVAQLAAWGAAAGMVWEFHHYGIPALAGAAGAYLVVLIVLKAWLGGAR
ncbi:hypothetical protein ABH931_005528 [Streptacidiphilus sp. MAP12-33]|uniref:hypothetical protein n=1 Tax=Streptacidiphilus sp. MAP12-33 TaxID=3156266 RepID=UPI0035148515